MTTTIGLKSGETTRILFPRNAPTPAARQPARELGKHDGITYAVLDPRFREEALEVLTEAFLREPSSEGSTLRPLTAGEWRRFTGLFMDECTTNGLSVVALDGERVAGVFINRDFLRPVPAGLQEFTVDPSPMAPLIRALVLIDEAWFERHPEIPRDTPGKVADLWMVGVRRDYAGRGIASRLARYSTERVAEAGFDYAIVECTGAFSQRLIEREGFRTVHALPYKDLLWNGEAVFRNVPPPHTKWVIYEKDLRGEASRA